MPAIFTFVSKISNDVASSVAHKSLKDICFIRIMRRMIINSCVPSFLFAGSSMSALSEGFLVAAEIKGTHRHSPHEASAVSVHVARVLQVIWQKRPSYCAHAHSQRR